MYTSKLFADKVSIFKKQQKKQLLLNFCAAILAYEYSDFLEIFTSIYLVLKLENIPLQIMNNFQVLGGVPSQFKEEINIINNTESDLPNIDFSDFESNQSKYINNRFVIDIKNKFANEVKKYEKHQTIANPLFNSKLASYFLRKLGPFSALWGSYCHKRATNSFVESYFNIIKHSVLRNLGSCRPVRAIKEIRINTLASLQKIRIRDSKLKIPRKKGKFIVDDPKEMFKQPKPPSKTNFEKAEEVQTSLYKHCSVSRIFPSYVPEKTYYKKNTQTLEYASGIF